MPSLISLLVVLGGWVPAAHACTTFLVQGDWGLRVGKSYDWHTPDGMVMWNRAEVAKRALALSPGGRPAQWRSRYASLTFNQYGREMPNGGMNSQGLVVEIMWLTSTEYPPEDDRPVVGELQWIQMQLDQSATVAQAVQLARTVRVMPTYAKVHYLACDRSGDCAAFEYIEGRLEVRQGDSLPVPTLTNSTYDESLRQIRFHQGFGGPRPLPLGTSSSARFIRASARAASASSRTAKNPTRATFSTLDSLRQGGDHPTQWQIVYDPMALEVAFRTDRTPDIKRIRLASLSPQCSLPPLALDMDQADGGDVSGQLVPWSMSGNRALLARSLAPLIGGGVIPAEASALLTRYAASATCEPRRLLCAAPDGSPRPCATSSSTLPSP